MYPLGEEYKWEWSCLTVSVAFAIGTSALDPEPDLHHTGTVTERRGPVGTLRNNPMGDMQRAGVAGDDGGARAAADATATAAAEGGRADMAAAHRGPDDPLGNTPRGVIQRTGETGGARGQRGTADRTGAGKDGRKRGRDGEDDMDQGGGGSGQGVEEVQ